MAEKKEKKETKKAATKKVVLPPKTKVKTLVKEEVYPAAEIAQSLSISDFAFLIMKRKAGITDGTFLTITEFRKLYKEIIGR